MNARPADKPSKLKLNESGIEQFNETLQRVNELNKKIETAKTQKEMLESQVQEILKECGVSSISEFKNMYKKTQEELNKTYDEMNKYIKSVEPVVNDLNKQVYRE